MKPPICIFTFNRSEKFIATVNKLKENFNSQVYELYIFIDGPRSDKDKAEINKAYEFSQTLEHFRSTQVFKSDINKGLAKSIISGVTKVFESHDSIIVVEDDLLTSKNFLCYMTEALEFYKNNKKVGSISGFSHSTQGYESNYEGFFQSRAWSWGWGTWKKVWENIDWDIDYVFNNPKEQVFRKDYDTKGGSDRFHMLEKQFQGKINSWYIRFDFNLYKQNLLTFYPYESKVINDGFDDEATHTSGFKRYPELFDTKNKREFVFPGELHRDKKIEKQFLFRLSLVYRIYAQIRNRLKL